MVITLARTKTPSYILTLPLKTEVWQEHVLEKRFEIGRKIYNACLSELLKRYKKLQHDNTYKTLIDNIKDNGKQLNELRKQYGLSEYAMHEFVKPMYGYFKQNIDSDTGQKIATRAWNAIEKLMFGDAEQVYFKKYGTMDSLEGKRNKQGVKFRDNQLVWNGLNIPVIIRSTDIYAHQALQDRIKYCRIQRKLVRGKVKYYIQLVLEGIPPRKYNKETGEIKHPRNDGVVGIDIGTQTISYVSKDEVKLLELAPEVNNIDKEKRRLQRKLDRQRRANNPHKYNEDGTIKKGNKDKWIWSKNYFKTRNKLADMQRKLATIRKQSHEKLANHILSLGNEIKVEQMNYKGLQKRAKDTTINEKTGRYNKKKRFGKSLANKAPAMLLSIIDRKLRYQGRELIRVNTFDVKASQYNHITDEYTKKNLSERWSDLGDFKIQRDLYSAFLIMNVYDGKIDREKCFETFDEFKVLHDIEINNLVVTSALKNVV